MMKFDPHKQHRHSIRLKGYDYTRPGAYFVTLNTWQQECLFGEIRSGEVCLNSFGGLVENEWRRLGNRFNRVVMDAFIVMPNHVHGILVIVEDNLDVTARGDSDVVGTAGVGPTRDDSHVVGARQEGESKIEGSPFASPLQNPRIHDIPEFAPSQQSPPPGVIPGSLGTIVGAYKSTTARLINGLRQTPGAPVWQRNFYEHIIRGHQEWGRIRAYIETNPLNWETDQEFR